MGIELNPGGGELQIAGVTKVYRNWTELKPVNGGIGQFVGGFERS
jgi:hypothetical protein